MLEANTPRSEDSTNLGHRHVIGLNSLRLHIEESLKADADRSFSETMKIVSFNKLYLLDIYHFQRTLMMVLKMKRKLFTTMSIVMYNAGKAIVHLVCILARLFELSMRYSALLLNLEPDRVPKFETSNRKCFSLSCFVFLCLVFLSEN